MRDMKLDSIHYTSDHQVEYVFSSASNSPKLTLTMKGGDVPMKMIMQQLNATCIGDIISIDVNRNKQTKM